MSSAPSYKTESVFSVDVEDWFHILDIPFAPSLTEWDKLPSRVEANFNRLLDIFSRKSVRVTCFFLGWIAQRYPHLVKEAVSRGHEIASHGYAHRLAYEMTPREFREDALHSRLLLEDISGSPVRGYRSAGFSTNERTPWFFEQLAGAGYSYDSSVFPVRRGHGGMSGASRAPHLETQAESSIVEFPITVANFVGTSMCFFGGGYLRLFPYWLIRRMAQQVLEAGRPVVFYIHPREIDPWHPRLPMSRLRRFKSYINLHQTEEKILRILDEFPVTTFRELMAREKQRWALEEVGNDQGQEVPWNAQDAVSERKPRHATGCG